MLNKFLRRSPLFTRVVFYVFLVAVLVSIMGAAIQLHFAYENERQNIVQMLDDIKDVQLETLTKHIWDMDYQAMDILLQGILGIPDIVYIELEDELNNRYSYGAVTENSSGLIQRKFPLVFLKDNNSRVIGNVLFVASTAQIKKKLLKTTSKSLAVQLLTLVFACFVILFLFIQLFNKHINTIVHYTQNLKIGRLDQHLELVRKKHQSSKYDELDLIVNAINNMRESLMAEIQVQRQTEKQLKNEKHFSDVIINSIPGLLFVLNDKLRPIRFNQAFLQKVNLDAEKAGNMDIFTWVAERQRKGVRHVLDRVLQDNTSGSLEVATINSEGAEVPYLFTVNRLVIDQTTMIVGVGSDLSEQKRVEDQLRQAQKMEAIGTLAGGIAHDFNNILSAIFGYVNLAQVVSKEEEKVQEYLAEVFKASTRAKELVSQILAFSRKKESEKKPMLLGPLVKEALKLLRSSIPTSVEIYHELSSEKLVVADVTEVHQIIMNLCTNAYHALGESKGLIEVTLKDRMITHLDLLNSKLPPGAYVQLTISDNGAGMSDEVMGKIFEPYFTTKGVGTGTGLGLAVVHGIVAQYGGAIEVYSRKEKGTIFNIFLPVAESGGQKPEEKIEQINSDYLFGSGKIMVIEDDRSVRHYIDDILSHYGYEVFSFGNPENALEHFRRQPHECDLVITDLTMPGLSGHVLGKQLMEMRNDLPVIITSGFSAKLTRKDFMDQHFADYIQKPVETLHLLRRIREILNASTEKQERTRPEVP